MACRSTTTGVGGSGRVENASASAIQNKQKCAISFWIKTAGAPATQQILFLSGGTSGDKYVELTTANKIHVHAPRVTTPVNYVTNTALVTDTWQFIHVNINDQASPNAVRVYHATATTFPAEYGYDTNSDGSGGRVADSGGKIRFCGSTVFSSAAHLYECSYWNGVISYPQILEAWARGPINTANSHNLELCWMMDEVVSGTSTPTVFDYAKNRLHGTSSGVTWQPNPPIRKGGPWARRAVYDSPGGILSTAGTSDGLSTAVAALKAKARFTSTADGLAAAVSALKARGRFTGAADGLSTGAAALKAYAELTAAADGLSAADAILAAQADLTGSADGLAAAAAALKAYAELTAAADGIATADGVPSIGTVLDTTGTSAGLSTAAALMKAKARFIGSATGTSTSVGILKAYIDPLGGTDGLSTADAQLKAWAELLAASGGFGTADAALKATASFDGTADGTSESDAILKAMARLIGDGADGIATADGDFTAIARFTGASTGLSEAEAVLKATAGLTAAAGGLGTASALLKAYAELTGMTIEGVSTSVSILKAYANFVGTSAGVATADGHFELPGEIVGSSAGTSTADAVLKATAGFTGTSAGSSTAVYLGPVPGPGPEPEPTPPPVVYPNMPGPSYLVEADEDGYVLAGPTWDGTSYGLILPSSGSRLAGMRFTGFPVTHAARGAGMLYTAAFTYDTILLSLAAPIAPEGTLTVRLSPEVSPDQYSGTNLPLAADGEIVGTVDIDGVGPVVIPLDIGKMTARYRRYDWPGAFALSLQWTGAGDLTVLSREGANALATPAFAPTITVTGVGELTGLEGPWKARSRADRCPRCGHPSVREEWVRDGYTRTLVCKRCWDPDDPLRYRRVPRPETPGINDAG